MAAAEPFATMAGTLTRALDALANRRILLFGGKGGVGKTTLASLAALHAARSGPVVLFSTDPASNLSDVFAGEVANLRVESVEAGSLWNAFLATNLESFVELGDRGTYLDREEIRRLFELSVPGIDELMGWLRIGELAEENPGARIVVDTAPTGHTLRLLCSGLHFEHFSLALEEMQAKHRALVRQLARRRTRDALDGFLEEFRGSVERRRRLLADAGLTAFVPVFLAEPWVIAQTRRLIEEVRVASIDVPLAVMNQATHQCDCEACRARLTAEERAVGELPVEVVRAPRACVPLDSIERMRHYLAGRPEKLGPGLENQLFTAKSWFSRPGPNFLFFAGKGGVGKTTSAASVALQLAARGERVALISVDPAHSVRDVFAGIEPPPNLRVEAIDTRAKWNRLRARLGDEIERAVSGLTAPNISISHDTEVLRELLEIAPPGADEIFAIMRLADLADDPEVDRIVVDTAPTGHFLRLLELPATAGEWVREMMRLLLRYKELVAPGVLGEELLDASKALRRIEGVLISEKTGVVIVARAERVVVAETARLEAELERRGVRIAARIVNALTPETGCRCDASRRAAEMAIAAQLDAPFVAVDRAIPPPTDLDSLRALIPME